MYVAKTSLPPFLPPFKGCLLSVSQGEAGRSLCSCREGRACPKGKVLLGAGPGLPIIQVKVGVGVCPAGLPGLNMPTPSFAPWGLAFNFYGSLAEVFLALVSL